MHITDIAMGIVTMMGSTGIRTATSIVAIDQMVMAEDISTTVDVDTVDARPETQKSHL